jgi:hypothetical protein
VWCVHMVPPWSAVYSCAVYGVWCTQPQCMCVCRACYWYTCMHSKCVVCVHSCLVCGVCIFTVHMCARCAFVQCVCASVWCEVYTPAGLTFLSVCRVGGVGAPVRCVSVCGGVCGACARVGSLEDGFLPQLTEGREWDFGSSVRQGRLRARWRPSCPAQCAPLLLRGVPWAWGGDPRCGGVAGVPARTVGLAPSLPRTPT